MGWVSITSGPVSAAPQVTEWRNFNLHELETWIALPGGPVAKEMQRLLAKIERLAKQYCPVDTGRLRASITTSLDHDGTGWTGLVGSNVEYAKYVEYGTSRMAAQSFLRRAINEVV